MADASRSNRFIEFALVFALIYLGTQMALRFVFPEQFDPRYQTATVVLEPVDATVKGGHHPVLRLRNSTDVPVHLPDRCPLPPVDVYFSADGPVDLSGTPLVPHEEPAIPCTAVTEVPARSEVLLDLAPWKYSLFQDYGRYAVRLEVPATGSGTGTVLTAEFSMHQAGFVTQAFRAFVTKPLLNLLVFIASQMPGYNLGLAIILLTLVVKMVLFFPTQHGLEGQRKLQAVQPALEALKRKYKGDPQKLNQETIRLWREHKINPFQSCLPMLVQFPVLIGLFFVIRDGSHLALSRHLLYSPYAQLPWTFGTRFLGLDLLAPSVFVMPPLLMALQFLQMKLSFARARRKRREHAEQEKEQKADTAQDMQQKIMLYGLPVMIGVFAFQFPAAVSLYWAVSTVFAIGQQVYVNRRTG